MPQSDAPAFRLEDVKAIRRVVDLTERAFAVDFGEIISDNKLQRLRDIADRIEVECENGVPGDFTEDDVAQLRTLGTDLRAYNLGIDPKKLTLAGTADLKGRQDAAAAADRIAAIMEARLR